MPQDSTVTEGVGIWQEILDKCATGGKVSQNKTALVFGNSAAGKAKLVSKLTRSEVGKGLGLTFSFLDIMDPEEPDELLSKILVWIFSPDGDSTGLVNSKLTKDTVGDSVAIIVLDLTRPWTFLDTLRKYTAVLEKRAKELDVGGRTEASEDGSGAERYLGFPLIVVGTKADLLKQTARAGSYSLDYIQYHLRSFCLAYGASLLYTSPAALLPGDVRNGNHLRALLEHALYGRPLQLEPNVTEPDLVFVPAGWDDSTKLEGLLSVMLSQTAMSREDLMNPAKYAQFVKKPSENAAMDMQSATLVRNSEEEPRFLLRLQSQQEQIKPEDDGAPPPSLPAPAASAPITTTPMVTVPPPAREDTHAPERTERPTLSRGASAAQLGSVVTPTRDTKEYEEIGQIFRDLLSKKARPKGLPAKTSAPKS